MYLDTNFVYRLLGVQGPRYVRAAEAILRATQAAGYVCAVTPWTIAEYRLSLDRSKRYLERYPKGVLAVSRDGWARGIGEQWVDEDVGDGFDWTGFVLAFRGVSLEGLEIAVIVVAFGAAAHAIASAAVAAAASVLLIGALGFASYRLVARIPRRALQLFVGALLTTFGTFWAGEGLRVNWPGNDLSLLWLAAVYVAAGLMLVRVVSDWRRGTAQRPLLRQTAAEGVSR